MGPAFAQTTPFPARPPRSKPWALAGSRLNGVGAPGPPPDEGQSRDKNATGRSRVPAGGTPHPLAARPKKPQTRRAFENHPSVLSPILPSRQAGGQLPRRQNKRWDCPEKQHT